MKRREGLRSKQRWVIKIGSALLTNDGTGLDRDALWGWVEQVAALVERGCEVVIVSSGAIAAGVSHLGWPGRPDSVHEQQAAAAVGQAQLVQAYEQAFSKHNLHTAQVLLDHDDLKDRRRYLNARSTIRTLNRLNIIPIVNENDTVVTDEIRFGDNDTLGALVANLIEADVLCILTDQDAMYDSDPRTNPEAKVLSERSALDSTLDAMAGDGGALGRGGMTSKVRAARLAARSGANTVIVGGRLSDSILRVAEGEDVGTLLYSEQPPIAARKRWLVGQLQSKGEFFLDDGAVRALRTGGHSLLPVGVKRVRGQFSRGDLVICRTADGSEIARGLSNYNSTDSAQIAGYVSRDIEKVLGYRDFEELIHRDNLVLI